MQSHFGGDSLEDLFFDADPEDESLDWTSLPIRLVRALPSGEVGIRALLECPEAANGALWRDETQSSARSSPARSRAAHRSRTRARRGLPRAA